MAGISIALATYNGETYLAEQLESLAAQTRLPAELVVADDCSTDRTVEIANEFASRAPFPVHIIRGENRLGFRDNFMRAAQRCAHELIAFCDQDDIWEPAKLAVMERQFDDPQVLLAYHNAILIGASGAPIGRFYRGNHDARIFEPLSRDPWLVVPGFMQVFRRTLMEFSEFHPASYDADWPGHPLAHDRWLLFLASVLGCVAYVGQPLVRYRQHGANVYGSYPNERAHFDRLARGIRFIRAAASAAGNRIELLRQIEERAGPAWRERAAQGVVYYETIRSNFLGRKSVYTLPTYRARLRALLALLRNGSYGRRGPAGFSLWDFLLDFYLAAPLGPRLRRLLRK
jgi:glycosyltransferase involved in cell wall biosynthesis